MTQLKLLHIVMTMMKKTLFILIFLTTYLLVGCAEKSVLVQNSVTATSQTTGQVPTDFDLADSNSPGGKVYTQVCAACHERGLDRAPQRTTLVLMTPRSIYRAMTEGVMQIQSSGLSDEEKISVAEYLGGARMGSTLANIEPPQCEGKAANFDFNEPPVFAGWGLTHEGTHAIPEKIAGLTKKNVGTLKLKWAFAYPDALRARSQPAIAGGALYVGSQNNKVYAFDRQSGCARWSYATSAEVRTGIVVSPWTAGDESAEPLVFFGDLIGNVYALDAVTGVEKWRGRPDEHPNTTLTAAPALYEGVLYVPVSSLEVVPAIESDYECCHFRGSVVAYDALTGEQKWQTFTIPIEPRAQKKNTVGTQNYGPSGAPIWNTPAIDIKRRQLTVGTGENYSSPASGESDAIIAMDIDTGEVNWIYQATVADAWNVACGQKQDANCPIENGPDFDFGAGTLVIYDSTWRDLVIAGQKSGMVHALDPDTGQLVWQTKVGRGGIHAGIYFGMAAADGRLFVPVSDTPDGREYTEAARPGLYALDLRNGDYLWQAPSEDVCREDQEFCQPGYGAAITTTAGMVIAGAIDGHLRLFDTQTGKVLWDFDTAREFAAVGGAIAKGGSFGGGSAPIAYKGQLIINSGYGFAGKMPGNALLVFEVE